jgi:XrtJ-associated TM-motif-TM protein
LARHSSIGGAASDLYTNAIASISVSIIGSWVGVTIVCSLRHSFLVALLVIEDLLEEAFMKPTITLYALGFAILTLRAHAQIGCDDSPENPTAILALVGIAGFFLTHAKIRRQKH